MPAAPPKRSPIDRAPTRHAGESLETRALEKHIFWWFTLAGAAGAWVAAAVIGWGLHLLREPGLVWYLTGGAVLTCCWAAWSIRGHWQAVRNLYLGAAGERTVADVLAQLQRERGYHVLHDIPIYKGGRVGGRTPSTPDERPVANIDHILIGPAGVLVIETKTLSKPAGRKAVVRYDGERLLVDGHTLDRDPIAQARRNAADVRAMIREALGAQEADKVPVRPVVLFPGWWVEEAKGREVWVLNPERMFGWLRAEELSQADRTTNRRANFAAIDRVLAGVATTILPSS